MDCYLQTEYYISSHHWCSVKKKVVVLRNFAKFIENTQSASRQLLLYLASLFYGKVSIEKKDYAKMFPKNDHYQSFH